MKGFLLDTHIWFWYLRANARLPHGLRAVINEAPDDCWLSPASIWELGLLEARGRIELDVGLRDWVGDALSVLPLKQAILTTDVAIATIEIDPNVRDPADRFIAATAVTYELALMTVDQELVKAGWIETRSA